MIIGDPLVGGVFSAGKTTEDFSCEKRLTRVFNQTVWLKVLNNRMKWTSLALAIMTTIKILCNSLTKFFRT